MMTNFFLVSDDSMNDVLSIQRCMKWCSTILSNLLEEIGSNSFEYPRYHRESKKPREYFKYFFLWLGLEFFFKAGDRHAYTEDDNHKYTNHERDEKEVFVDTRYKCDKSASSWNSTLTSTELTWSCTKSCPFSRYTTRLTGIGCYIEICSETREIISLTPSSKYCSYCTQQDGEKSNL